MFSPKERDLERGWPGRIDDRRVVQLAAQTLQAFFTGGGGAREHAEFGLDEIDLRAPVLHPPSIRVFGSDGDFAFANPASVYGPEEEVPVPPGARYIESDLRLAAVIGAQGTIGGFTLMNDWVAPELIGAKARDFATSFGPVVVTPDEFAARDDWKALVAHAARGTRLLPGDVIAAGTMREGPHVPGDVVELELPEIGVLRNVVGRGETPLSA
jgi:2-keto-4-pentenoate hydratase/2-oxohepta-3-ene-1,7-dioic acid hydratase in catechol pathway